MIVLPPYAHHRDSSQAEIASGEPTLTAVGIFPCKYNGQICEGV